ncbi:MAG: hypothetical protein U0599_29195, partial [Vicinamibacteria bacterium]
VAYMSAEQVRGGRPDGRSDLFSAGTVLCELLTGKRPFDADDPGRTLYRIANEEPDIVFASDEDRRRFLPILRRALARDPEERYASAAEFAAELRACLVEPARPGPAAAPPPPRRADDPSRLFELLREVFVRGKTGQLHLSCGGSFKSLTILKGQVLHGTSDVQGEHLGDVLVRYGLLSHDDMQRAVAVVLGERRRLGDVLAGMRLLDAASIAEAVGIHVREILFSALDRADASFSFEELAESNLDDDLACPQSMGQVILEATRRVFDPELVRRLLGDTSRALTLSPDPRLRAQKMTLTPTDGFVLSRIDGTLSASDLVALIPLPPEDTERSLFSLLCTGVVSYREDPPRRPAAPVAAPLPTLPVPAPTPAPVTPRAAEPAPLPPVSPCPRPRGRPPPEPASNPYAAALPPAAPPEAVIRVANRALEAGDTREAVPLLEPLLESAEGGALVAAATLLAQAYARNPKWKKRGGGPPRARRAGAPLRARAPDARGDVSRGRARDAREGRLPESPGSRPGEQRRPGRPRGARASAARNPAAGALRRPLQAPLSSVAWRCASAWPGASSSTRRNDFSARARRP